MQRETPVPELATLATIVGSAILLYGTARHSGGFPFQAAGGAIVVVGIFLLAGYLNALPTPEGEEGH